MSTVFLHVGQCGNQIGQSFWKTVSKDQSVINSHSFVDVQAVQRSVHVDSEPKVICKLTKSAQIRNKNVCTGKRGRGTNWALGYNGLLTKGDDSLLDDAMDSLRKEVERCDSYMGVVLMHSLSGGTGSGLGSRLCECVRDEYPMNYLMSCAVVPCAAGESPLQHYNSLLTLSHLQRYADGILLLHNDEILRQLQKKSDKSVSYDHINQTIASSLCGALLPTETFTTNSGYSLGMEPWELVRSVCPMPSLKFMHVLHQTRSKVSWDGLVGNTLRALHRYDSEGKALSSIANVVVGRGDSAQGFVSAMKRGLEEKVKQAYNCVPWNPLPVELWSARRQSSGTKDSASLTIVANHSSVIEYLDTLLQRSKVMYEAGAYLHWYWRYKATPETFDDAFDSISTIVGDYKSAVS